MSQISKTKQGPPGKDLDGTPMKVQGCCTKTGSGKPICLYLTLKTLWESPEVSFDLTAFSTRCTHGIATTCTFLLVQRGNIVPKSWFCCEPVTCPHSTYCLSPLPSPLKYGDYYIGPGLVQNDISHLTYVYSTPHPVKPNQSLSFCVHAHFFTQKLIL